MNKKLKGVLTVLSLTAAFSLTSCLNKNNNNSNTSGDIDSGQNEVNDVTETYTSISEASTAVASSLTDDQKNTILPTEYTSNETSISASGNYYFTGTLSKAISVAKKAGDVHIYLDNVTISVEGGNAFASKKGANVTITLIGDNNLSNTGTAKHVIDSKENLVINGDGSLTINSTKSAIACDQTFIGLGGVINATAANHVVSADSIYLDGMTINATSCGKDVLHAESDYDEVEKAPTFSFGAGYVCIADATINTTTVLGDAIQADSFVDIKAGTYNLTTTPTWNDSYVATVNEESGMYDKNHNKVSRDSVKKGTTYSVLEESVKGIKVGEIDYYLASDTEQANELTVESDNYTILIEGGTFNINTVDDAIHTNSGNLLVYGGNLTINTSDDGLHADNALKIAGSPVINITNSYEGIEGETIDISGGNTTVVALDDGVNASNGDLTTTQQESVCQINISGGRLDVTVNPNGDRDGIDSNGGMKITGGTVITRGPNSQNACALDAANAIAITGGIVISLGYTPGTSTSHGGNGGRFMGGPTSEGTLTTTLTKTQDSSKGLSKGSHTVTVGSEVVNYTNAYAYSGYTTVYASETATIA